MRQGDQARTIRLTAAALVAVVFVLPRAGRADALAGAPLAGVVTSGEVPVAGVELLVHGLSTAVRSFSRVVRTGADGTWVIPSAPAGLYAVSSLARGFRPAVARLWHRAQADDVSFVALKLEKPGGILPPSRRGDADPWLARAVTAGDVLREEDAASAIGRPAAAARGAALAADLRGAPLHASLASTTGFGASNGENLSATSVDLGGTLGPSFRWGLEGQYRRLDGAQGGLGDASHLTLDVAPGDQSFRVSARRQSLDGDDDPARFASQAIAWSGAMGDRSRASLSARLVSESNLLSRGPVSDLFASTSNAFEVEARYRAETGEGTFVRVAVGYRAASATRIPATAGAFDRETHVGGGAGVEIARGFSVEAGATGDISTYSRGVMPEVTLTIRTDNGLRVYGFVARRFEQRAPGELPLARAGTDDSGLARLSHAAYRTGIRWDGPDGASLSFEASRRELQGTYRLLLDPDFLDHLDSLYYLDGDVALEVGTSTTFRVADGLQGRLAAGWGRFGGAGVAAIARARATYTLASAALRVGVTRSVVSVAYREVAQELERARFTERNELSALDFTLAQSLPIPFLRALGTEWQALLSLEVGNRLEGDEVRANRRLSGGLALNF